MNDEYFKGLALLGDNVDNGINWMACRIRAERSCNDSAFLLENSTVSGALALSEENSRLREKLERAKGAFAPRAAGCEAPNYPRFRNDIIVRMIKKRIAFPGMPSN